ncbi:MAG: Sapep family Mn(2+)-dependent dipeptidase [Emergencia sp.]|nr:Sapep family Mn(2+)-dependent dipeptidase [Emergencia sp.]
MDNILKDLQALVAINSVSKRSDCREMPFGEGANQALETALSICEGYGFRVKNCNHMTGYAEVGEGQPLIGILVHLDIVPAGDGWKSSPFELRIEDGKIFGRGVTDDKGPAVAVIHAIKELIEEGCVFNHRVRMIFGLAEETGDWDDMEYYKATEEQISYGFTPDADFPAIYAEMGIANASFTFDRKKTCFTHIEGGNAVNMVPDKCTAEYIEGERAVICSETGKSAHGSTPWDGENAICALMAHLTDREDCQLSRFFKECIGTAYNGKALGGYASDKESGEITYNFGLIHTEDDEITLTVDIRYPVTYQIGNILDGVRKHLEERGFGDVQVKLLSDVPYAFLDKESDVMMKLLEAYREHTGDMTPPAVIGGGTYARAMKGIVAFGPMLPGRELTEHQPNEYILQEDLSLAKEIYKTAIRKLAVKGE